ncbi:MAG: hypothetical protein WKH64_07560, partial [Chloroflexia bacterium]
RREVWTTTPGGRPERLGGMHAPSGVVAVSSDGRTLAYLGSPGDAETAGVSDENYREVWIVPVGGGPRRLGVLRADSAEEFVGLSWSPDGERLLAVVRTEDPEGV